MRMLVDSKKNIIKVRHQLTKEKLKKLKLQQESKPKD